VSEKWAKMPQALVLDSRVSDGAKVLYSRLYHHEYRRARWGKLLPTRKALAAELGRGSSTVGNQLAELERYGWVTIHRQGNGQRWDRIETHMVSQNPGAPVISNPGAPSTGDEPESWRIPVEELQVPPAEAGPKARIYSGPAPKNEGQGLIPSAGTSDLGASARRPSVDTGSTTRPGPCPDYSKPPALHMTGTCAACQAYFAYQREEAKRRHLLGEDVTDNVVPLRLVQSA